MHPELRPDTPAWRRLIADLEAGHPDVLLLNELPFGPWIAARERFDRARWDACVAAHAEGVAGCYVASSNRGGVDSAGEEFEGRGCVVDPLGQTVVETSPSSPVAFYDIDPSVVAWKKTIYPCDVA
jgi:predicted amidohydrolase